MATSTEPRSPLVDLRGNIVLVLEDDQDTLELLRTILSACGARVHLASSVQHARAFFETVRPNLIVSDLALPQEDGLAFIRWLRGHPHPDVAALPIVAVTAFYEDYPPGRVSDADAYFQKPVPIDRFCRAVADLVTPRAAG